MNKLTQQPRYGTTQYTTPHSSACDDLGKPDLRPATGVINGMLFGTVIWIVIYIIYKVVA